MFVAVTEVADEELDSHSLETQIPWSAVHWSKLGAGS